MMNKTIRDRIIRNKITFMVLTFSVFLLFQIFSCTEDRITDDPKARLKFSTDTVLFDTIFTRYGSTTKHFLVYNRNKASVKISKIKLGGGITSSYRLNIDGEPATEIKDYIILPGDSIYIFVDVIINPNAENLPFIVKDSVTFLTNGNLQQVKLMAWGQNAHFLHDSMLGCNTVWEDDLPYVISNHVGIDRNCNLTIKPGVKIYSDNYSGIFVWGTLVVEGEKDKPVMFTSIRQDNFYKDIPGQWYGIRLLPGSKNNYFKFASIRNSIIGIECDSLPVNLNPNLILENVRIENVTAVGLLGYSAHITAYNLMINNSCKYLVVGDLGGTYNFFHCTFYQNNCSCVSRDASCIFTNNPYIAGGDTTLNSLNLNIYNSIIYGPADDELILSKVGNGGWNVLVDHCLIKSKLPQLNINSNILNKDPFFKDKCKDYYPGETSPVINKGITLDFLPPQVAIDLDGNTRSDGSPDLGALEKK